jgi:hypothetical protein
MATSGIDEKKAEEFVGRVLTDTSAAMITTLCALGRSPRAVPGPG